MLIEKSGQPPPTERRVRIAQLHQPRRRILACLLITVPDVKQRLTENCRAVTLTATPVWNSGIHYAATIRRNVRVDPRKQMKAEIL